MSAPENPSHYYAKNSIETFGATGLFLNTALIIPTLAT